MYIPQFSITNKILLNISNVEAARQIIENAPLVPAWERRFREEAEVRTIHFSTKIEGNKLGLEEARNIITGENVATFRRRDIQEIINYRGVINFLEESKGRFIDKRFLLDVHKKIMAKILPQSELGKLRKCDEVLMDSSTQQVVFEPVGPAFIEGEIDEIFEWLHSKANEVHPILKAGIISYEIVRIHPFVEGNGRSARILATYSLYADGYDIKRFFALEEYYDQNLDTYYKALASVEEEGDDLTHWLEFFTDGLAVELTRVKNKVLDLSRDVQLKNQVGQIALNERQIKLINFVQKKGYIKNQDWQKLFPDVSDDTILRDLKDLIKKRIIKKEGRTKSAQYILV
jgi:Fic family protein